MMFQQEIVVTEYANAFQYQLAPSTTHTQDECHHHHDYDGHGDDDNPNHDYDDHDDDDNPNHDNDDELGKLQILLDVALRSYVLDPSLCDLVC
jgi:hypothetical protein